MSALVSSGVDASRLELFREVVGIGSVEFVELLRRGTGLGNQMGGMDYAAVSVGLRRFDSRLKQERKMRRAFKNIVEMLNV